MLRELPSQRGVAVENNKVSHAVLALDEARHEHLEWGAFGVVGRWEKAGSHFYATELRFCVPGLATLQAFVLGRHTQSDLRMIPYSAQRHALILCWPPYEDHPPFIEAIDLFTTVGLGTPGGERLTHVAGEGYLRFCTGPAHTIVFFAPAGKTFSEVLKENYSYDVTASGMDPVFPFSGQLKGEELARQVKPHVASNTPTLISVDKHGNIDDQFAEKTRNGGHPVVLPVRRDDLFRGLMIGRHERCPGYQSFSQNSEVSRLHYCLISRRGQLWAIDSGSTNGTRIIQSNNDAHRLNHRQRAWLLGPNDITCIGGRDIYLGLPVQDYRSVTI